VTATAAAPEAPAQPEQPAPKPEPEQPKPAKRRTAKQRSRAIQKILRDRSRPPEARTAEALHEATEQALHARGTPRYDLECASVLARAAFDYYLGVAGFRRDDQICRSCSLPNPVWFTPNPVWSDVMGPGGRGVLCPACFIAKAEEAGVGTDGAWLLVPAAQAAQLIQTDPGGATRSA
jgi:hypothetical protein